MLFSHRRIKAIDVAANFLTPNGVHGYTLAELMRVSLAAFVRIQHTAHFANINGQLRIGMVKLDPQAIEPKVRQHPINQSLHLAFREIRQIEIMFHIQTL